VIEDVAEVRASLVSALSLLLQTVKLSHSAGNPKVRSALAPIARGMAQGEVVLRVGSLVREGNDVIDVKLVQRKIDRLVANEAAAGLALVKALLQLAPAVLRQGCEYT
jgi:hypothetical protein